jgi:hypothetical protein
MSVGYKIGVMSGVSEVLGLTSDLMMMLSSESNDDAI